MAVPSLKDIVRSNQEKLMQQEADNREYVSMFKPISVDTSEVALSYKRATAKLGEDAPALDILRSVFTFNDGPYPTNKIYRALLYKLQTQLRKLHALDDKTITPAEREYRVFLGDAKSKLEDMVARSARDESLIDPSKLNTVF